jgi:hypothetical protein
LTRMKTVGGLDLKMFETREVAKVGYPTVGQGLRQQDRQMRRRYDVSPGMQYDIIWRVLGIVYEENSDRELRNRAVLVFLLVAAFRHCCIPSDIWLAVRWGSGSRS